MENASPSPVHVLRDQWLTMVKAVILTDGALGVVESWLSQHPDYDPATFWTLPGKDGYPALPEAFVHGKHEDWVIPNILPIIKRLAPSDALAAQYNQPGDNGKVLLQLMWEKRLADMKTKTSYGSRDPGDDLAKQWVGVLDKTDPTFWTFMDRKDEAPGAGMRRTLMNLLSLSPSDTAAAMANGAMDRLAKVYPAAPTPTTPEDSPWRGALSSAQVDALATLGHRLDEPVAIGTLEVPAWEWLLMQNGRSSKTEFGKAVEALAATQGLTENLESWRAAQKAEGQPHWGMISPTDRRASTGYVAAVIKFKNEDKSPCFDLYGRSPLDYLLNHRSDLFGLFAGRALSLPSEEFRARFMQPDRAGVPAILRYLPRVPDDAVRSFQSLLEHHDCWTPPEQLLVERGGLCAWELKMSGWNDAQDRSPGQFPIEKIVSRLSDPAVVFGPTAQQQAWNSWWEGNISRWHGMREWLTKTSAWQSTSKPLVALPEVAQFPRIAIRQLKLFLSNGASTAWQEQMDPALLATLQVASCAITSGLGDEASKSWFSSLTKQSHELANLPPPVRNTFSGRYDSSPADKWGVTLSRNPPEAPSPTLLNILATPAGTKLLAALDNGKDLPGRHWSWKNDSEPLQSWSAWHKRAHLMLSVSPVERNDNRLKM